MDHISGTGRALFPYMSHFINGRPLMICQLATENVFFFAIDMGSVSVGRKGYRILFDHIIIHSLEKFSFQWIYTGCTQRQQNVPVVAANRVSKQLDCTLLTSNVTHET